MKNYSIYFITLFLLIIIAALFRVVILNSIFLDYPQLDTLTLPALMEKEVRLSGAVTIFLGFGNALLIWIVVRKIMGNRVAILSSLLYLISPWTAYLDSSGSVYSLLIFATLLFCLGSLLVSTSFRLGLFLLCSSIFLLLFSSIFMWIVLPLLIFIFLSKTSLTPSQTKIFLLTFLIILSPFMYFAINNREGVSNIVKTQVTIFSDVGLLNAVNEFQGNINQTELASLGRFVENRYFYLSKHTLFNFLKHFSPATYFTPQVKLLEFSFSPPILLGFMIPFFLGLPLWINSWRKYKYMTLLPLIFLLPSIFSNKSPDMFRLSLVSPFIFITIANGFEKSFFIDKNKKVKLLLLFSLALILFQGAVVFTDILIREPVRLQKMMQDVK